MKFDKASDVEKARGYCRKYFKKKGKDWNSGRHSEWVKKNPMKIKAASQRYYRKNKAELLKKNRDYYLKNKEKFKVAASTRRAMVAGAAVNMSQMLKWRKWVKSKLTAKCYYCGDIVSTKSIHFDHVIPLVRGGQHSVDNLCVSCAPCNLQKNRSLISEWYKAGQLILGL